jgi:hypothetical protein
LRLDFNWFQLHNTQNYSIDRKIMKTLSQIVLFVMTVAALTACGESGKGPSKPSATSPSVSSVK